MPTFGTVELITEGNKLYTSIMDFFCISTEWINSIEIIVIMLRMLHTIVSEFKTKQYKSNIITTECRFATKCCLLKSEEARSVA